MPAASSSTVAKTRTSKQKRPKVAKKKAVNKKKSLGSAKAKQGGKVNTVRGSRIAKSSPSQKARAKKKTERFKVGDYLVYPMHGVGQIVSVSRQNILGKSKSYYMMEIESNKMKVMVPVENAAKIGVRSIINRRQVTKVINLLKKNEVDTEEDWKVRYQNNMNKIKSGDIYSVAEVCRNLYKRARDRELSLMERRLYESAYKLISTEIALSKNVSLEEAGNMISEVLA